LIWGQPEPFSGQTNPREECPAYLRQSTQRATYDIGSRAAVIRDLNARMLGWTLTSDCVLAVWRRSG
jgi:hypothetical protein